jgi:hypothetical protein
MRFSSTRNSMNNFTWFSRRADEQVKGIKKMMVYRNLLIHATMAYEKTSHLTSVTSMK